MPFIKYFPWNYSIIYGTTLVTSQTIPSYHFCCFPFGYLFIICIMIIEWRHIIDIWICNSYAFDFFTRIKPGQQYSTWSCSFVIRIMNGWGFHGRMLQHVSTVGSHICMFWLMFHVLFSIRSEWMWEVSMWEWCRMYQYSRVILLYLSSGVHRNRLQKRYAHYRSYTPLSCKLV